MRLAVAAALASSFILTGCMTHVADQRMGPPRPARADDCKLEFLPVSIQDAMNSPRFQEGGEFEIVGQIVIASSESDPLSPKMRDEVRPRACRLGGDAISLGSSTTTGGAYNQATAYVVWGKRRAPSATPEAF